MNFIVLSSLICSVVGLVMIYFAATEIEIQTLDIEEINQELVGRTISTEGYIKSKNFHEDGHLFLTISNGKKNLQVPVFSSVMQSLNKEDFELKSKIKVTGLVDQYRNQIQIIPRKPSDIQIT